MEKEWRWTWSIGTYRECQVRATPIVYLYAIISVKIEESRKTIVPRASVKSTWYPPRQPPSPTPSPGAQYLWLGLPLRKRLGSHVESTHPALIKPNLLPTPINPACLQIHPKQLRDFAQWPLSLTTECCCHAISSPPPHEALLCRHVQTAALQVNCGHRALESIRGFGRFQLVCWITPQPPEA